MFTWKSPSIAIPGCPGTPISRRTARPQWFYGEVTLAAFQILYWHDIPLQVRAREGRKRASRTLTPRFQAAVDNASMKAGLTGDDDYLALLRWSEAEERSGSPDDVAEAVAAEIEARFQTIDWNKTVESLKGAQH
jgi:Virulence factor